MNKLNYDKKYDSDYGFLLREACEPEAMFNEAKDTLNATGFCHPTNDFVVFIALKAKKAG